jgi:iron complex outermembrane receptor protein
VATHLNGIYLGSSNLATARMFDLERIEVLKGPQGTLYGRNATGGSINLITSAAAPEFSSDIEAAYGSFNSFRVQGHVNTPFDDSALRLAWTVSDGDGFIRNSVDDRRFAEPDFWGMRLAYRIQPSDRLQLDLMAQHIEDDGAIGELWLPNPDFLPDASDIHLTTVTLPDPYLDKQSDAVSANLIYDLGFATLAAVSGFAGNTIRDRDDCAGIPELAGCVRGTMPARTREFNQEIRLVSPGGETLDWLVGAFYFDDDTDREIYQSTQNIDPQPTIDGQNNSEETSVAVFGQVNLQFKEKWSVTAGLRLNRDEQSVSTVGTGSLDSPTLASDSIRSDKQSWRFDLQYMPSEGLRAFAGVSTGYKSGGIAIRSGGVLDEFAPEELLAFEAGMKFQAPSQRFRLNASAFYYDFRDLQVNTVTVTDDGPVFETDNAARAEIYGIDADSEYKLNDRLIVSGSVVWLPKRAFVEYRNDRTGDTLSGNDLSRAPEWSLIAAFDYSHPLRRNSRLGARLEYSYRSSYFYTTDNLASFSQNAFGLLNLFLRFEPADANWYLFATGRNLADEGYFNQVFLQASPGYPDTYEAGFGYRF